jgi:hypothetical protein
VVIAVAGVFLLLTLNQVKVSCRTNREPGVFTVVKRLRDLFKAENILIERGADGQIRHINSDMVQFYGNIRILFLRK